MAVPYTFANATTSIPLSQLDSNFATGITIGNTAVYLGNTTTSFGNVTLTNATISSGNATVTKITVPTVDAGSGNALTLQSNSTTGLYIDTSQNVGIGTSSPSVAFEVSKGNNTAIRVIDDSATTRGGYIKATGSSVEIGTTSSLRPLVFTIDSVEKARIDTSGKLLVGTTSSVTGNELFAVSTSGDSFMVTTSTGGSVTSITGSSTSASINYMGSYSNHPATFRVNNTERMRIDTSGNLLVGTTSSPSNARFRCYGNASADFNFGSQTAAGNNSFIVYNQSNVGVYLVSGNTSWTATSDERLKDIIEPITDATNKVSKIRAVIGKYKTDEQKTRRSFLIAQDVQKVLPEAVSVSPDEEKTLGLQYNEVIPLLVAAIQELKAEIDTLKGTK